MLGWQGREAIDRRAVHTARGQPRHVPLDQGGESSRSHGGRPGTIDHDQPQGLDRLGLPEIERQQQALLEDIGVARRQKFREGRGPSMGPRYLLPASKGVEYASQEIVTDVIGGLLDHGQER